MMNLTARTPSFVSSSGLTKPGEDLVWISRSWKNLFQVTIERGNLCNLSRPDYTQEDYGRSWSSQEWKSGAVEYDRSGKSEGISWDTLQKVDPHREERLLDRNAAFCKVRRADSH